MSTYYNCPSSFLDKAPTISAHYLAKALMLGVLSVLFRFTPFKFIIFGYNLYINMLSIRN